MRNFLRKSFLAFCLAMIMVVGLSTTSHAEECLDIRDYGYHRYNHRCYDVLTQRTKTAISETTYHVQDPEGHNMLAIQTTYEIHEVYTRTWVCVCGKEKSPKETFSVTYQTTETQYIYI